MRVGLLTYHFSDNYGALFQAYALREWFIRRGIDAEFINYHPRYVEEGGSFDSLLNPKKFKKNLTIGYLKASHYYWSLFGDREQREAFDLFRRQHLGLNGQRIFEPEDLIVGDDVDLLVCGSDQIWNPSVQKGLDPIYFLDLARTPRAWRISYAPSFGRATLPAEFHAEAGRMIAGLDAVSVREHSGVEIVRNLSGREAACVPDPTILLNDFSSLLGPETKHEGKHVFCYALRTADLIRGVAEHVAESTQSTLISPLSSRQRWKSIGESVSPGPVEWLRLLNTAETVVTNSFHGVALSIILNRPFIAVALPGKKASLNERILNLLSLTGLLGRIAESDSPEAIDAVLSGTIDWSDVNARLAGLQEFGKVFLEQQIAYAGERRNG